MNARTPLVGRAVALTVLLLLAAGCAGPALVNMWRDQDEPRRPMQKLLVVAMLRDAGRRRIQEDALVRALDKYGADATPSYRLYRDALPDTQQVLDRIRDDGFDGMVISHRLPGRTSTQYYPGYVETVPVGYINPWTGVYTQYLDEVEEPGYVETERVTRYRVDVWSADRGGTFVWTGTTESLNPESAQEVSGGMANRVASELAKQGIIGSGGRRDRDRDRDRDRRGDQRGGAGY